MISTQRCKRHRFQRYLITASLAVLLAGCSTSMRLTETPHEPSSPYTQRQDALGTLLDSAWQARNQGNYDEAESYLNRAVRISPTTPDVYYQLALLRQQKGQFEQTIQMAQRALSLQPDANLSRKIHQLIKTVKREHVSGNSSSSGRH